MIFYVTMWLLEIIIAFFTFFLNQYLYFSWRWNEINERMNETGFDTSNFDRIVDLGSLKSGFDKIDIDKPKTAPIDLKKLSDIVEKDFVKNNR